LAGIIGAAEDFDGMDLVRYSPNIDVETAAEFLRNTYGIHGRLSLLPSERDQNFLIAKEDNDHVVLKIANAGESLSLIQAQNEALAYAASQLSFCPRIITTQQGASVTEIESDKGIHLVRLVTYIEGVPLAQVRSENSALLEDLGRKLGMFDRVFSTFDNEAFHRDFHWDLSNGPRVLTEYLGLIADRDLRHLVELFARRFDAGFGPLATSLRRSVIHGDANDYNVIVRDSHVVGLIDFGDMVYSYTVGDLAIALAYIILNKREPLSAATNVVTGYLKEYSLTDDERGVLWDFTLLRLCMSVCLSAHQQMMNPDNDYLGISQRSIRESLGDLMAISSEFAADHFQLSSSVNGRAK
jgi:Ser/Thr protein kinase RdoA (MazF antagonist)